MPVPLHPKAKAPLPPFRDQRPSLTSSVIHPRPSSRCSADKVACCAQRPPYYANCLAHKGIRYSTSVGLDRVSDHEIGAEPIASASWRRVPASLVSLGPLARGQSRRARTIQMLSTALNLLIHQLTWTSMPAGRALRDCCSVMKNPSARRPPLEW